MRLPSPLVFSVVADSTNLAKFLAQNYHPGNINFGDSYHLRDNQTRIITGVIFENISAAPFQTTSFFTASLRMTKLMIVKAWHRVLARKWPPAIAHDFTKRHYV